MLGGSSPHMRETRDCLPLPDFAIRFIPAHAGNARFIPAGNALSRNVSKSSVLFMSRNSTER